MNSIILMGRLCADPELKTTQSAIPMAQFRIAVERAFTSAGERKADFIQIIAWRTTAEFVKRFFHKGSRIIVIGSLQSDDYTDKDGNKKTAYKVVAEKVEFVDPKVGEKTSQGEEDLPF